MSLSGARGPVLLSRNPACQWLAAIIADRLDERDFYAQVAGEKYTSDYGLQVSATQRGIQFEKRLYANDGARLRRILRSLCGVVPNKILVRSFAATPVSLTEPVADAVLVRNDNLIAMRHILRDLRDGNPVPHLIIQPQLQLPVDGAEVRYISPDFMLLLGEGKNRTYICGEIKSHILRENMAAPADRQRARLQAAVETIALHAELDRLGIADRVSNRAIFIYASPYDLSPAPPVLEQLDAEIHEIRRAVLRIGEILSRLRELRKDQYLPLQDLLPQLNANYTEACSGICLLARVCKARIVGHGQALGDDAASVLGYDTDLSRLVAVIDNKVPQAQCTQAELEITSQIGSALSCIDFITDSIAEV